MTRFAQAQVISLARLACTACGAEANASCNCGKPYVPAKMRVAEYDKANPGKSTREAAADLGVDQSTVVRARRDADASPDTVTGRDGKEYPAKKQSTAADRAEARCAARWKAFMAEEERSAEPDEETAEAEHQQGLRVIAARGFLNRANEARGLADLGKLKSEEITPAMIELAECVAAEWASLANKMKDKVKSGARAPSV